MELMSTFHNFQKKKLWKIIWGKEERKRRRCWKWDSVCNVHWSNEIRIFCLKACLSISVLCGNGNIPKYSTLVHRVNKTAVWILRTHVHAHTQIEMWYQNIPLDWIKYAKYSWCWWHFGSNFENICTIICVIELFCLRACVCEFRLNFPCRSCFYQTKFLLEEHEEPQHSIKLKAVYFMENIIMMYLKCVWVSVCVCEYKQNGQQMYTSTV